MVVPTTALRRHRADVSMPRPQRWVGVYVPSRKPACVHRGQAVQADVPRLAGGYVNGISRAAVSWCYGTESLARLEQTAQQRTRRAAEADGLSGYGAAYPPWRQASPCGDAVVNRRSRRAARPPVQCGRGRIRAGDRRLGRPPYPDRRGGLPPATPRRCDSCAWRQIAPRCL